MGPAGYCEGSGTHRAGCRRRVERLGQCRHVLQAQLCGQLVCVLEDLAGAEAGRHEVSRSTSRTAQATSRCRLGPGRPVHSASHGRRTSGKGHSLLTQRSSHRKQKQREPESGESGKSQSGGSSTFRSSRSCCFIISSEFRCTSSVTPQKQRKASTSS